MKAAFIKQDCLVQTDGKEVRLRPGAAEALKLLAERKLFVVLLDVSSCSVVPAAMKAKQELSRSVLEALRVGGGHVDALVECPHHPDEGCGCWGLHPGFLYAAAARLDMRLDECYLLCDQADDVLLGYRVGCRPVLVLEGRSIGDLYDGHQPEPHDFPIAFDLCTAVNYVLTEEDATGAWGHPRQPTPLSQEAESQPAGEMPDFSPTVRLFTPVPGIKGVVTGWSTDQSTTRRWLVTFVFGGVWLSLGIAYLLTHLYRTHPFPAYFYYLTLQFIPRPLRAALFILSGVVVVGLSVRAFARLSATNGARKR